MKKFLITILSIIIVLSMVGCRNTQVEIVGNGVESGDTQQVTVIETSNNGELVSYIYNCDDVYITENTATYGEGEIVLAEVQENLIVADYKLLLCGDECEPAEIVARMSQGYARVYQTVLDEKIEGKHQILKFKMVMPDEMKENLDNQEEMAEPNDGEYYYLLVLDETHYAYIHLERNDNLEKIDNESEIADLIIKSANVSLEI